MTNVKMVMPSSSKRPLSRRQTIALSFNCHRARLNSLWSMWYCVAVVTLEIYLTATSIQHFAGYIGLPWPEDSQPYFELNAYVGLVGAAVVLLPFFVVAAVLQIGNLANDGYKFGSHSDTQVLEAPPTQPLRLVRTVWHHSGPTAPFLHIVSAFCLLLPKVLIQAKLIKHGFLRRDDIWRTDLDFMITYKDRIVVLSFLTPANFTSLPGLTTEKPQIDPSRLEGSPPLEEMALITPEFVNYVVAQIVYAIRYPSVFWETNQALGLLFSVQLILNVVQSLLAFTGFVVLYKLQVFGPDEVLPHHEPFLLGTSLVFVLFIVYCVALTATGSTLYFYAYQKYKCFVAHEKEKHLITWKSGSKSLWGYLPHCVALAMLFLLALCSGPLIYDATIVYRASLDGAVLACVIGTVLHLFFWVVLWLFLTLKNKWYFRLEPGTLSLCDGKSSKLLSFIEMARLRNDKANPLIVISNGHTFTIHDNASRKTIINILEKVSNTTRHRTECEDDDIYWLKPKPPTPKESPDMDHLSWLNKKQSSSPALKHKVTFDDSFLSARRSLTKSPKTKIKKQNVKFEDLTDSDDDGDYATLRDLPLVTEEVEKEAKETDELFKASHRQLMMYPSDNRSYVNFQPVGHFNTAVTVHKEKQMSDSPRSNSCSSSSSPPGKCSDSSSGFHSASSTLENQCRRSSSVDELQDVPPSRVRWKSLSLQRGPAMPPTAFSDRRPSIVGDHLVYFDPNEVTFVVKRKQKMQDNNQNNKEPFERATNLSMTSFRDEHLNNLSKEKKHDYDDIIPN